MGKPRLGNEYWRLYTKRKQERWRSLGLCIDCGIPSKPFWRCIKCRRRVGKYNKAQYEKRKHALNKHQEPEA